MTTLAPVTPRTQNLSGQETPVQARKDRENVLQRPQNVSGQGITLESNHPWEEEEKGLKNLQKFHSAKERSLAYLKTDGGLFRFGQLMDRVPRTINVVYEQMGRKPSPALYALSSKGLTGWTWLTTFPRIITMTPGVIDAVKDARNAAKEEGLSSDQRRYKYEYAFREATDFAAMLGYGTSMAIGLFPQGAAAERAIRTVADGSTVIHDVTSFGMNVRNYQAIGRLDLEKATAEMQQTLKETRTQNMFAIIKDVISVVSGILGLTFVTTGFAVVPGIVLVTISLASTVFAVIRDLYKDTMMYKPIQFFNNKHVTQLTA